MRFVLILALLAPVVTAQPANSCADPYWKGSLRCTLFPNEVPQPNLGEVPRVANNQPVPKFTRVFLSDPNVRCTDGTRPLIYVDKAAGPAESNRWIFTVSGGDSCSGERCAFFYAQPDGRSFMGSVNKEPMKDLDGIHDPDPAKNPVFAGYNRVRVEKCTFDRYMGRAAEEVRATLPDGNPVAFTAYHHGFLIYEQAFKTLQNGLRYTTWRRADPNEQTRRRRACCGAGRGNQLMVVEEELPPLADAEVVLLIGHSNASHGHYHNADHLAALLRSIPGFDADVRAVFDANFLPSVENEAAFAATAPPNSDSYHHIWSGTTAAQGQPFTYDGERYHATATSDLEYAAQGAIHDQSCLDAHAADGTAWMCRDRQHVLFNHITTPFLVRQDFSDPNRDHLDVPYGHWVRWGDAANYSYCTETPCEPRFTPAEFRARIEKQVQTLLASAWTRSELARGIDESPESRPTMFVWMPDCAQHEGSYGDDEFFGATIATTAAAFSMREWVEEFMDAPASGVRRYLIDGANDPGGRLMRTLRCR